MPDVPERLKIYEPFWGEWTIEEEIGSGTSGTVFRVRQTRNGQLIQHAALKWIQIPNKSMAAVQIANMTPQERAQLYADMMKYLMREVESLKELRGHPNIVTLQDYKILSRPNGEGYDVLIRMELLTPMESRYPIGPKEEPLVIRIAKEICTALVSCQAHGIVHRDIKPSNVFVDRRGICKIGDFGIAKTIAKTMGSPDTRVGTPLYMAPEMFGTNPHYDASVDTYALGIIMYRYLNDGNVPFWNESKNESPLLRAEEAQSHRLNFEKVPPAVNASKGMNLILLKAIEPDPKKRYIRAEDMLQDLQLLEQDPEKLIRQFSEKPKKTADQSSNGITRILLAVLIVSLLALVGSLILSIGMRNDEDTSIQIVETMILNKAGKVISDNAPVYYETGKTAFSYSAGQMVSIISNDKTAEGISYYRISLDDQNTGFIQCENVDVVEETVQEESIETEEPVVEPTPQIVTMQLEGEIVSEKSVIRINPGRNEAFVDSLNREDHIYVTGSISDDEGIDWYRVETDDGRTGFIQAKDAVLYEQ